MPYLRKAKIDPMVKLIRGYGLNCVSLADALGTSTTTGWKRINNPELLTLGDLRRLSTHGHIPIDEIRNAV